MKTYYILLTGQVQSIFAIDRALPVCTRSLDYYGMRKSDPMTYEDAHDAIFTAATRLAEDDEDCYLGDDYLTYDCSRAEIFECD